MLLEDLSALAGRAVCSDAGMRARGYWRYYDRNASVALARQHPYPQPNPYIDKNMFASITFFAGLEAYFMYDGT